jgi:fructoselysine-6-P-deglycase FrlB-like protein
VNATYLSHDEIFGQADTLERTVDAMVAARPTLGEWYGRRRPRGVVVAGCGSSYCVALSVAAAWQRRLGIPVQAAVGSDLLRHPTQFDVLLRGGLLVTLSRSGKTTELVVAVEQAKQRTGTPVLSVGCTPGSPLDQLADLAISLPWSHERSVCQTRSVSNLYLAALATGAAWASDEALEAEVTRVPAAARGLLDGADARMAEAVAGIVAGQWTHAVLLGDGELYGAAAEGAMILTEMAQVPSVTYHTLDVRHGPSVLVDAATLAILFRSGETASWETDLVADLRAAGATVLATGAGDVPGGPAGEPGNAVGGLWSDAAMALIAGLLPQTLAYGRALHKGLDPDQPRGLTQWIDLAGTPDPRDAGAMRLGAQSHL